MLACTTPIAQEIFAKLASVKPQDLTVHQQLILLLDNEKDRWADNAREMKAIEIIDESFVVYDLPRAGLELLKAHMLPDLMQLRNSLHKSH